MFYLPAHPRVMHDMLRDNLLALCSNAEVKTAQSQVPNCYAIRCMHSEHHRNLQMLVNPPMQMCGSDNDNPAVLLMSFHLITLPNISVSGADGFYLQILVVCCRPVC